jgi:hypothetical protein
MMGRKKAQPEKQDQGDGKDGPKLADVVRQALGQLGTEASAGDVRNWIGRNYTGYSYNDTTLGTTLSNQRKKLREAAGSAIIAARVPKTTLPGPSSVPSGDDLLKVKRMADNNGGIEGLLRTVQTVHDLGAEVGGIDKLLRCLEMLHDLIIK